MRQTLRTLTLTKVALAGLVAGVVLAGLLCAKLAHARAEAEVQYSKAQTFSSALRYLRIDLGYTVTEKDPDAAYLMFEYQRSDQKKPGFGTIEIVETQRAVKIVVRLPDMPEYRERVLSDGLLNKLRAELGDAPSRKPPNDDAAPEPAPPGKKKPAPAPKDSPSP